MYHLSAAFVDRSIHRRGRGLAANHHHHRDHAVYPVLYHCAIVHHVGLQVP